MAFEGPPCLRFWNSDRRSKLLFMTKRQRSVSPAVGDRGRENSEIREILRAATRRSAPMIAKIACGENPFPDLEYAPTPADMLRAFDRCARYSLPELEPVVEERFIHALAEVLAADERVPFECIGSVVEALIGKLRG